VGRGPGRRRSVGLAQVGPGGWLGSVGEPGLGLVGGLVHVGRGGWLGSGWGGWLGSVGGPGSGWSVGVVNCWRWSVHGRVLARMSESSGCGGSGGLGGEQEFLRRTGDLCRWWSLGAVRDSSGRRVEGAEGMGGLRETAAPFVALGPSSVAVRDRLKGLTAGDEEVLRLVGDHLGTLASRDLRARCTAGLEHDGERWAERKRALTPESSSRWAGSVTKATHDQWALARRGQHAHVQGLEAGVRTIAHRLSLPVGEKGSRRAPGGYRSRREWRQDPPPARVHRPASGGTRRRRGRARACGARREAAAEHPPPPRGRPAHRGAVARAVAGRTPLPAGRRRVRPAVRQRDDPRHPGRRGDPQAV
jgi:hypothetical protein